MLFIEALSRAGVKPNTKKHPQKSRTQPITTSEDSVALSPAAHEVKEIHLDSQHKSPLSVSSSIFANLIEHTLSYLFNKKLLIISPEEIILDQKEWQLFLQVPPHKALPDDDTKNNSYQEPEIKKPQSSKQLKFYIPVKPAYGNTIKMTVILSVHQGSPEIPYFFSSLPKENTLPLLKTPDTPEIIKQQVTYYHLLFDKDGEPDQLSALYPLLITSPEKDQATPSTFGLRLWRVQGTALRPVVLGDRKVGLLYIGHYQPIEGHSSGSKNTTNTNYLYTKA